LPPIDPVVIFQDHGAQAAEDAAMNSCTPPLGCSAAEHEPAAIQASLGRLAKTVFGRLRTWISQVAMDDETAYLSRATDMADLERRLRVLDLTGR
jgi:Protein of unknown function (DUF3563)